MCAPHQPLSFPTTRLTILHSGSNVPLPKFCNWGCKIGTEKSPRWAYGVLVKLGQSALEDIIITQETKEDEPEQALTIELFPMGVVNSCIPRRASSLNFGYLLALYPWSDLQIAITCSKSPWCSKKLIWISGSHSLARQRYFPKPQPNYSPQSPTIFPGFPHSLTRLNKYKEWIILLFVILQKFSNLVWKEKKIIKK